MPGPRQLVAPPGFADRGFGLLSTVELRDTPEVHWRNGVTFTTLCGLGSSSYDDLCVTGTPAAKAADMSTPTRGATPFVAFAEVDCPPVGYIVEEQRARGVDALTRTESWQVERAFWTGQAGGDTGIVYPHLAADTTVLDVGVLPEVTLQCAATSVTGSVILDVAEGLGRLEAAYAGCANGQGVIHVPTILAEQLWRANVVKANGPQLRTQLGNLVAVGAGYPGTGPDGGSLPNAVWVYMTGPVFAYRSMPETFAFRESLDRSSNTVRTIVERTYVLGFDCCCLFALPISVGGIVTGAPLSPF